MSQLLSPEVEALWRRAEDALADGASDAWISERLAALAAKAPEGSEPWCFAHREMAARLVATDPWHASLLARRVLGHQEDDDRAWGLLGLGQSLIGHHGFAIRAYRRAVVLAPSDPWYAHNLGHLIDVVRDQPQRALPLLRRAVARLHDNDDVTASYAHALARAGYPHRARELMRRVLRRGARAEHQRLYQWIVELTDADVARRVAESGCDPRPRRRRKRVVVGGQ